MVGSIEDTRAALAIRLALVGGIAGLVGAACAEEPPRCETCGVARDRGAGWRSAGVGGGGALFSPSISPHDGREIFMASDLTGVYHTTNFGRRWRMVPFQALRGGPLSQVRFTADRRVLYAVRYSAPPPGGLRPMRTLVKSRDGGASWSAPVASPGAPGDGHYLFVDPDEAGRLLFSDTSQLFSSTDGGRRFRPVHTTGWAGGLVVGGVHWDGDTIHVGTSDGVLVSRDGGATFALDASIGGIPPDEKIVSFAGARRGGRTRFFAVTFSATDGDGTPLVTAGVTGAQLDAFAGLYRLDPGSARWTPSTAGLGPNDRISMVAASRHDPGVAYVAGGDRSSLAPVLLKTEDGGASWRHVFSTQHNRNIATGWSGSGGDASWEFGEYALGLAVSPADPDRVALTDLGFVHLSRDGGRTFQQAYVRPADQNPRGLDTPRSRFYRTSGVEQTSSWWLHWSDEATLFASLTDIRSIFSRDGGVSWSRDSANGLTLNTTYHVIQHPRTGALYAATSSVHDIYQSPFLRDSRLDGPPGRPTRGGVMVSNDGGAAWSLLVDAGHPVIWLALDPSDPDQLYASVIHSIDGGIYRFDLGRLDAALVRLPPPPRTQGHPFHVHVLGDGSILATYSGHQPGDTRIFTDRSGVFLLARGATAWQDRSSPEMHFWTKDIVLDPNDPTQSTWYVAVFSHDTSTTGGLYRTRDRGASWQRISDQPRVESCAIDPRDPRRMYMTTEWNGLWLTENLDDDAPIFRPVVSYPFGHPMRVFWNPFDPDEVWTTSFGGGLHRTVERSPAR